MPKLLLISLFFFLSSATGSYSSYGTSEVQKKIIRQGNFDIEFFVLLKNPGTFDNDKIYFWYKAGQIHQSISGSGGLLLHSSFQKYYRSKQLAEQGVFNNGLKNGIWKKWHENGKIELVEEWKKGDRNGIFIAFDATGKRLSKGYYKNNKKSGDWINYTKGDTVSYNKGEMKIVDPNKKENFLKRLFKKKESGKDSTDIKKDKKSKSKKSSDNKEGFLKRLFKKKDKKQSAEKSSF